MNSFLDWALSAFGGGLKAHNDRAAAQSARDNKRLWELGDLLNATRRDDMKASLQQAQDTLAADPLGSAQRYAQRSAILQAIWPQNLKSTPGDPAVAAHVRGVTLPSIPLANPLQALANRDMQRANRDPNAPATDLGSLYGADATTPYTSALQRFLANRKASADQAKAKRDAKLPGGSDWTW